MWGFLTNLAYFGEGAEVLGVVLPSLLLKGAIIIIMFPIIFPLLQALILGKADPKLSISRKVYELIYELNNICPRILLTVLPQLEFKLKSTEESERLGSVSLLARMFSEKGSSLAQKHRWISAQWLQFNVHALRHLLPASSINRP